MRAESLASSQSGGSVDADGWCKHTLRGQLEPVLYWVVFSSWNRRFSSVHSIVNARQRSCGKVMFSQACVKNSVPQVTWPQVTWPGWGLCRGGMFLSRGSLSRAASVHGGVCPLSLCPGGLYLGGLCPDGGLCPRGSLSRGSLSGASLSRWGFSVGVSVQVWVSVWGSLPDGILC